MNTRAISEAEAAIREHYDFWEEVTGWMRTSENDDVLNKALPYYDIHSLRGTQRLGARLFHESMLGKVIHENLVSYIVGEGHQYTVKPVGDKDEDEITIRAQSAVDLFLSRYEWPDHQEEFINRWFRTGDTFRIIEPSGGTVDFAYIESHNVRPPETSRGQDKAPFGIEYDGGNVNREKTFYVSTDGASPKPVAKWGRRQVLSHGKRGVDRNDPRGVPLLWVAYCPCREIDELDRALSRVMAQVSEHAVEYNFLPGTSTSAISQVTQAKTAERTAATESGQLAGNAGGIHLSKDHSVVMHGVGINGADWIEVLHSKMRRVGVLAQIPEFILTGDAETGSRNTLFVAEAPFTRRISREARRASRHEIEILYHAIAASFGKFGDQEWMDDFKSRYVIDVEIPIPESQDKAAETNRVLSAMDRQIISPQIATQLQGYDYDAVQRDWDEHIQRQEERRESFGSFLSLQVEEIRVRAEVAQGLIARGVDPNQALEYVGLDPTEHGGLLSLPANEPAQPTEPDTVPSE